MLDRKLLRSPARKAKALVAAVALVGFGAFAATSLGGGGGTQDPKQRTGPPERLDAKRISSAEARAAGAVTAHRRHRFRVQYLIANQPISVPAGGATQIQALVCPRRWAAINGFYFTDGGIVADVSFKARPIRRWLFAFVDLTGQPGEALPGIVCARIR